MRCFRKPQKDFVIVPKEMLVDNLSKKNLPQDGEDSSLGEEDADEDIEEDEEDEDDEEGSPGFRGRSRDPEHVPAFDKRTFLSPKKRGKRPRSRPRKKEPDEQSKNNYPTSRQAPADATRSLRCAALLC